MDNEEKRPSYERYPHCGCDIDVVVFGHVNCHLGSAFPRYHRHWWAWTAGYQFKCHCGAEYEVPHVVMS